MSCDDPSSCGFFQKKEKKKKKEMRREIIEGVSTRTFETETRLFNMVPNLLRNLLPSKDAILISEISK